MTKLSAVALCLLTTISLSAHANVFDTYGQSARTMAIGNASTAGGDSAFAAYTNPARLVSKAGSEIAVQVVGSSFDLQNLPEAPGSQLPPSDNQQPETSQGNSLGLNLALRENLHFGLATYMPHGNFGRIKGVSPYQATYLRYSEQQEKPTIYTALGIKLPWGLAIGAGAYYTLRAKGVLQISLSDQESEGRLDLVMEPVVVPYGGLSWDYENMSFGLFYREAQETQSKIESAFAFSTADALLPFEANTSLVPFYDPAVLRLGWRWAIEKWEVLFGWEQAQWSRYKTPLVQLTGNDVAAISTEASSSTGNLKDTLAYRLGVIAPLPIEEDLSLMAGLEWHTSANRSGKTSSVIDPARQSFALGALWRLKSDQEGRMLGIEAAYQYSKLESLSVLTPKGTEVRVSGGNSIQTFLGGVSYEL